MAQTYSQIDLESCKFHWYLFFFHLFVLPKGSLLRVDFLQECFQAPAVYNVSIEPLKLCNVQKSLGRFISTLFKFRGYLENVQCTQFLFKCHIIGDIFLSKRCSFIFLTDKIPLYVYEKFSFQALQWRKMGKM